MLRSIVFWLHLICGVVTGLVVLMMSATGVVLTYERQILAWADMALRSEAPAPAERLPLEDLVAALALAEPEFRASSVTVHRDSAAPVSIGAGRAGARYVDGYTAEILGGGAPGLRAFFGAVTGWHRWFNTTGDARGTARTITGASNLAFLFLILTGLYLWLPRIYRWTAFKAHLLLRSRPPNAKARDLNWHHVFGIWSALPLAIVVATAVVFSYGWANDLVYRLAGEQPPGRGGAASSPVVTHAVGEPLPLDSILSRAREFRDGWQRLTVQLPAPEAAHVNVTIDEGNGGQPQRRHTLVLDRYTGEVSEWQPFDSQSPGRQARLWVRFLHTGEALGIAGQTIAGLVSLTSLIMVWTGLALAYRRLIVPLFRAR